MTTSLGQTDTAAKSAPTAPAHPRAILAIILVSYFLILLDNSVIFTGLPSIASAMDLGPAGLSWVQDAYTLVFGGCCCSAPAWATCWAGAGSSSPPWWSS